MNTDTTGTDGTGPSRVLVVDDDRLNRMLLAGGVRAQGHEVTEAADGHAALARLREQPHDAVLLDIVMPGMDGFEVLAQLRADVALRATPVIVVSAVEDMASVVRAIEMGAVDYLPKPFDPVLLRARLQQSLQQKRLRDLEQAYLGQELTLRQNERLATLGRLAAGVAHELNNPAAAASRSVHQLAENVDHLLDAARDLFATGLDHDVLSWVGEVRTRHVDPGRTALDVADEEDALAGWLGRTGAEGADDLAPVLAEQGLTTAAVTECATRLREREVAVALRWIGHSEHTRSLLGEVHDAVARISGIVEALKGYTHLDRAPDQLVDVHAGLDDTVAVLAAALQGVTVTRSYEPDLPAVAANGPELNQLWTHLIANAADALGGTGTLGLETARDGDRITVAVTDDGPGIPDAVRDRVFDPFVSTKPPGAGTGLGLTVAHRIVTESHGGRIEVASVPGSTRFTVHLPITR
ncbi:response regulator [Pseudonocardia sp.]|uniref:sensor histidine kinase n=1 Tax=Pseudonocardia sp. TaxID=60912 RepID=UPI00261DCDA5|nr:response regulator [Pseudonocardia sp.]